MPYVSDAQRKYFNAQRGKDIPANVVDEYNNASRGLKLPKKKKKVNKSEGMSAPMSSQPGHGGDFIPARQQPSQRKKLPKWKKSIK
jgi:hypothetical protein